MLTNQTFLTAARGNNPIVISTFPFNENPNKFLFPSTHTISQINKKQLSMFLPIKSMNMEKACHTTMFLN